VVQLAKRYGITTPYTSYLLVPDGPLPPIVRDPKGPVYKFAAPPRALAPAGGFGGAGGAQMKLEDFAKNLDKKGVGESRTAQEVDQGRAQSEPDHRILDPHPQEKDVYCLGNGVIRVTPRGKAHIIDANNAAETRQDAAIAALLVAPAKK